MGLIATLKTLLSATVLTLIGLPAHAEPRVPADWKTDCVGRMQISLPGEVDIAAMLPKDLISELNAQGYFGYKFLDGQDASWSSSNGLKITHPITPEEGVVIDSIIAKDLAAAKAYCKKKSKETGESLVLTELPRSAYVKLAFRGKNAYRAYLHLDKTAVYWAIDTEVDDMPNVAKDYQTLITGLRPRPTFDAPKDSGVCLPYLFVKDDGKDSRHIGITYRLKAHPDITVWLEDSSAATIGPHMKPAMFTAEGKAAYFWERRYANRRSFRSLWPFHYAFKDTTMAGQKGVKTFVELTRDDEAQTKDYGYLVSVRGDPDAKEDTPDLMLYVIQDSVNATKRGIKPLTKDDFIDMAETIAASVKRRETGAN